MNVAIVSGCVIESIGMTNAEWQMQRKSKKRRKRKKRWKKRQGMESEKDYWISNWTIVKSNCRTTQ